MKNQYIFFGQFLRKQGLINDEHIFRARSLQKKHNRRIGELAMAKGWLTSDQVERILVIQEDAKEKFGEIAVLQGFLSKAQVGELLKEIDDGYLFFGEALVRLGVLSKETLVEKLKEFNMVFGNSAPAPRSVEKGQKAELSKKRLGASDCELMGSCDFFHGRLRGDKRDSPLLKVRYCMGASSDCARFMLYRATGNVPADLMPHETERARALLAHGIA